MIKSQNAGMFQIPGTSTTPSAGTAVAQNASANTYGSYVALTAGTSEADYIVAVRYSLTTTNQPTYLSVVIGTGGAGSETIVGIVNCVPYGELGNVANGASASIINGRAELPFPIPVAASTRIACKTASSVASALSWVLSLDCYKQADLVDAGVIEQGDLQTIKTQAVTCAAGVTVLASVGTASTDTAQTGDNFARIGAAGVGLTNLGDTRIAHLDADVSGRMATFTLPTHFSSLAISAAGLVGTVHDGTALAATSGTLSLDAGASLVDNFYQDLWVRITGGTGAGQVRRIYAYAGASQLAFITPNWITTPDATSVLAILPFAWVTDGLSDAIKLQTDKLQFDGSNNILGNVHAWADQPALVNANNFPEVGVTQWANLNVSNGVGNYPNVCVAAATAADGGGVTGAPGVVNAGTTGGPSGTGNATATTILLSSGASTTDGAYVGDLVVVQGDSNAGHPARTITAYTGATRQATVDRAWPGTFLPGAGIAQYPYYVLAGDAPDLSSLATNLSEANADLDELITTIGVAGAGLTALPGFPAHFSSLVISPAGVVLATVESVQAPAPLVSVAGLDAELSQLIAYELVLEAGLQNQMASLQSLLNAANASPQPTYTVSGPQGSQSFDWNGYRDNLTRQTELVLRQLNDSLQRVKELFDLKLRNLPYFKVGRR